MEKYLPPPRSAKIIPFPIRQRKQSSIELRSNTCAAFVTTTRNRLKQEQGLHFRRLHSKADGEPNRR